MVSHVMSVLKARRTSLQEKEKGFTLIELLVVIVIIGILAAIAIPVYLGVQNNAKNSAVQSDLTNAKTAIVAYQVDKNTLPDGTTTPLTVAALGTYGFTQSTNTTTIAYSPAAPAAGATAFCLVGTGVTGKQFWVTDSSGVVNTKPATGC